MNEPVFQPVFTESTAIIARIDIETLIPHRDRMKLVDDVVAVGDGDAVTLSVVNPRWPLFRDGRTSPVVMIELVAQTAAVCIGWQKTQDGGDAASGKGVLVGVKSAAFFVDGLRDGQTIRTSARIGFSMDHYTEIRGTVEIDDIVAAEIALQVLRQQNKETSG